MLALPVRCTQDGPVPIPVPGVDHRLSEPEPAHAFGGFIGPRTLVEQVAAAAPLLFDGRHPREAERPADGGQPRLHQLAFHPLGWWAVLLGAGSRLEAGERPAPAAITDYFALCLAAHWATAGSYVPTDVDAKIRGALWGDQSDPGERELMVALVGQLRHWDVDGFSTRAVQAPELEEAGGPGAVSGHDGERLSVLCAALQVHRAAGDEQVAAALEADIDAELAREALAWERMRAAAARARSGDTSAGVAWLRLAAVLAHNAGDVNQGLGAKAGSRTAGEAQQRYGDLVQGDPRRYGGAFAEAGAVYTALLAAEGHRHYPLRSVKALRTHPDLLLPIGPFLDDWGRRVAASPALGDADRAACVEALVAGCRKLGGQSGYYRALAGLLAALRGGLFDGALAGDCSAAVRRGLRDPELRRRVAVPRVSFESGLISQARNLLGAASRAAPRS